MADENQPFPTAQYGRLEPDTAVGPWTWPQAIVIASGIFIIISTAVMGVGMGGYIFGLLVAAPGVGRYNGRSWLRILGGFIVWHLRKSSGVTQWHSDPLAGELIPSDWSIAMPGIGERWDMYEYEPLNAGVMVDPVRGLISMVIDTEFKGFMLQDQDTQIARLKALGHVTSALAGLPDLDHVVFHVWTHATDPTSLIHEYEQSHPTELKDLPPSARQAILDRLEASKDNTVEKRLIMTVAGKINSLAPEIDTPLEKVAKLLTQRITALGAPLREAGLTSWHYVSAPAWRVMCANMFDADPENMLARSQASRQAREALPGVKERVDALQYELKRMSEDAQNAGLTGGNIVAWIDPETRVRLSDTAVALAGAQDEYDSLSQSAQGMSETQPLAYNLDVEADHIEIDHTLHRILWLPTFPNKPTRWGFLLPLLRGMHTYTVSITIVAYDEATGLKQIDSARSQRGVQQYFNEKLQRDRSREESVIAADQRRREIGLMQGFADTRVTCRVWVSGKNEEQFRAVQSFVTSAAGQSGWKSVVQTGRQWEELTSCLPGVA